MPHIELVPSDLNCSAAWLSIAILILYAEILHFSDRQVSAEKYQFNVTFKLPIRDYEILLPFPPWHKQHLVLDMQLKTMIFEIKGFLATEPT